MKLCVKIEKRLDGFTLCTEFETAGETLALLGASGAGKSMTLRCIAGIERPDSGRIVLNDRVLFDSAQGINLPPQKRRVGYLFQNYALFPHMTVEQNILAGAAGKDRAARQAAARGLIERFGLTGLERRRPRELSGGQQQRAALARILASEPELLLLDEPLSALDEHLRWQVELELADTLRSFPGGAVYVSHDREEVFRLCDTVCVLDGGRSGKKTTVPELFAAPASVGEARIAGCQNISRVKVEPNGMLHCLDWGVTLRTARPQKESTCFAGVRSRDLHIASRENEIACVVERTVEDVNSTIALCRTPGGGLLRAAFSKEEWIALGAPRELTLSVDPQNVLPLME